MKIAKFHQDTTKRLTKDVLKNGNALLIILSAIYGTDSGRQRAHFKFDPTNILKSRIKCNAGVMLLFWSFQKHFLKTE